MVELESSAARHLPQDRLGDPARVDELLVGPVDDHLLAGHEVHLDLLDAHFDRFDRAQAPRFDGCLEEAGGVGGSCEEKACFGGAT